MLTNLDASAPPPGQWSWKKLLLIALCILAALITAILTYDSKLEPYDDLMPAVVKETDAGTNGFFFLRNAGKSCTTISMLMREKPGR